MPAVQDWNLALGRAFGIRFWEAMQCQMRKTLLWVLRGLGVLGLCRKLVGPACDLGLQPIRSAKTMCLVACWSMS